MPPTSSPARHALGIDIGGTFTDLVLHDGRFGRIMVGKVLTNHRDLAAGVLDGVRNLLDLHGVSAAEITTLVHGTTLVANALIERRGAPTALIITRGFRDLLDMGRESRYDIFDIDLEIPEPLIPRRLVFEATERVDAYGRVAVALDPVEIRALASHLQNCSITSVAVCLLHSFRNPAHERAIGAILAEAAPRIAVSLSSDVMPDIREYERASTTAANAYVQPLIRGYLDRLATGLGTTGIRAEPFVIGSDASRVTRTTALRYPVRLVESGPAGGAVAASFLGARAGLADMIAFDMGGTTAKLCVIEDGEPAHADQFEVARVNRFAKGSGLPLKVPVIDMIEIGAGGGSIARIDALGLLRVGPESSGADPGPVCYGRGGEHPTVTDADLCLGYLDPASFVGGAIRLDREAAAAAIARRIAEPLGLTPARAAWGIHAVVNDNMARAAKVHCLERGKDPRDYVLIAYGGAGPVHAWPIAATLGIPRILYPMHAGVLSALGFLATPAAFTLLRADPQPLDAVEPDRAAALLAEMLAEASAVVRTAGVAATDISVRREAALRFAGQTYDLAVPLPPGRLSHEHLARLRSDLCDCYRSRYHQQPPDTPVELVSWRVVVTGPKLDMLFAPIVSSGTAPKARRPVFFPEAGDFVACSVYDRSALAPGQQLTGPAVIEEPESTVVIGPRGKVEVDREGNLVATLPLLTESRSERESVQ